MYTFNAGLVFVLVYRQSSHVYGRNTESWGMTLSLFLYKLRYLWRIKNQVVCKSGWFFKIKFLFDFVCSYINIQIHTSVVENHVSPIIHASLCDKILHIYKYIYLCMLLFFFFSSYQVQYKAEQNIWLCNFVPIKICFSITISIITWSRMPFFSLV